MSAGTLVARGVPEVDLNGYLFDPHPLDVGIAEPQATEQLRRIRLTFARGRPARASRGQQGRISIGLLHHHAGSFRNGRVPYHDNAITPIAPVSRRAGNLYTCGRRQRETVASAGTQRIAIRVARGDDEGAVPAVRPIHNVY